MGKGSSYIETYLSPQQWEECYIKLRLHAIRIAPNIWIHFMLKIFPNTQFIMLTGPMETLHKDYNCDCSLSENHNTFLREKHLEERNSGMDTVWKHICFQSVIALINGVHEVSLWKWRLSSEGDAGWPCLAAVLEEPGINFKFNNFIGMTEQACFVKVSITWASVWGLVEWPLLLSSVSVSDYDTGKVRAHTFFPTSLPFPSHFLQ